MRVCMTNYICVWSWNNPNCSELFQVWRNNKGGGLTYPPHTALLILIVNQEEEKFHRQISLELGAISLKIFLQFSFFLIWTT